MKQNPSVLIILARVYKNLYVVTLLTSVARGLPVTAFDLQSGAHGFQHVDIPPHGKTVVKLFTPSMHPCYKAV